MRKRHRDKAMEEREESTKAFKPPHDQQVESQPASPPFTQQSNLKTGLKIKLRITRQDYARARASATARGASSTSSSSSSRSTPFSATPTPTTGIDTTINKGLLIKKEWGDLMLGGLKKWEVRSRKISFPLPLRIRLIISGNKQGCGVIAGEVTIVRSFPAPKALLENSFVLHRIPLRRLNEVGYKDPHVWVVEKPVRYAAPMRYLPKSGCVIWVNLDKSCVPDWPKELPAQSLLPLMGNSQRRRRRRLALNPASGSSRQPRAATQAASREARLKKRATNGGVPSGAAGAGVEAVGDSQYALQSASRGRDASRADVFPTGSVVMIRRLQSKPRLNKQSAQIVRYDARRGRYTVKLQGADELFAVKPANLQQVVQGVTISGLQSRSETNQTSTRLSHLSSLLHVQTLTLVSFLLLPTP